MWATGNAAALGHWNIYLYIYISKYIYVWFINIYGFQDFALHANQCHDLALAESGRDCLIYAEYALEW